MLYIGNRDIGVDAPEVTLARTKKAICRQPTGHPKTQANCHGRLHEVDVDAAV